MTPLTVECPVHFKKRRAGRKVLAAGPKPASPPTGRIPRVARLMALAVKFDGLLRSGDVASQAELARLGRVSSARLSQIMNLLNLAPDIVEEILHLPPTRGPSVLIADLQPVAGEADWREQRRLWRKLAGRKIPRD